MSTVPLVGRKAELDELISAFEAAAAGNGSVCLVSGEPGIGKTRLAPELSARAKPRGAEVHWGGAWEVEGALSLWPWARVLSSVASTAHGRSVLETCGTSLGLLLPELRAKDPKAGAVEPEQAPFHLAVAL